MNFDWAEFVLAFCLFIVGPGTGFFAIWKRLGKIEDKLDTINGRVDHHDTEIAVHDERLDRLSVM